MASGELDFEELLKQYDYNFQKGDLVKGLVCGYDGQGVMVDIGAKTIAVVPTREAADKDENVETKLEKGKEYEFLIIREEDEDGRFLLSRPPCWQQRQLHAQGRKTPVPSVWIHMQYATPKDRPARQGCCTVSASAEWNPAQ